MECKKWVQSFNYYAGTLFNLSAKFIRSHTESAEQLDQVPKMQLPVSQLSLGP